MRLLSRRNEIKLGLIVSLIIAIIAGIVIYVRRPVALPAAPEEYAVYEAVSRPDHLLFHETSEGIDLDPELAARAGLALTTDPGRGLQVSRVTFTDNGTKAALLVGHSACGPVHDYIMGYNFIKDSAGWQLDGYPSLVREVFC